VNYPRNESIRWGWLARRCAELVFFAGLIIALAVQYIVPTGTYMLLCVYMCVLCVYMCVRVRIYESVSLSHTHTL
jgi:hypothetical protein